MKNNSWRQTFLRSTWRVKLSAILMGGGQLLYGCVGKGLVFLLAQISVIAYFIRRGASDLVGFFTLGTQKADAWTGTAGDNSIIMLLMGILAWIVLILFLAVYVANLKDACRVEQTVLSGRLPDSFAKELASLLDSRFKSCLRTPRCTITRSGSPTHW